MEHITYHPEEVMQIVERKLDDLKPYQYDSRYRMLLGESFVRKIGDWERNIRNRKSDPFTLVVCGEFKRGKSSLINAILGEDVVTTNVTTETVTLNKISYGPHSNEAVLSGGRRLQLADEDLSRENLGALIQKMGEPITQLELKRPLEILQKVTIVDTPGLGDALKDFSELVAYALRQADAVIYVFSANYPLSQTEQLFLKTSILPQKYTDLFLAANYCDTMPDRDSYDRMKSMLTDRVQGLLPGWEPYMLSALDERCLQLGEERPNEALAQTLADNFAEFRAQLEKLVEQKRYMVIPDRMQRLLRAMAADLEGLLYAMEEGLKLDAAGVQAALDQVNAACAKQSEEQEKNKAQIKQMLAQMRVECRNWLEDLLRRMEQELESLQQIPEEDIKKYYTFYCVDRVQEGVDSCTQLHIEQIYDALDEIAAELTKVLSDAPVSGTAFRFALENQTWTKGDNVGYVASYVLGGALSMIVDGVAGAMRQKEVQKSTPDLVGKIREQYVSFRASVAQSIDNTYENLGKQISAQLDSYYTEQIASAKEQVEQSALVARQDAQQKEEIRGVIAHIRTLLADLEITG